MVMTVEERKAQQKAYYEANKKKIKLYYEANKKKILEKSKTNYELTKDKIKAQRKAYYQENKDKILAYNKAQNKAYRQTEAGIKTCRMSKWRSRGVNNVTDELYDYFMNCDVCEVCGSEFTEKNDKCLDHNHDTGVFRYVLCRGCNCNDNWKKFISHTDTL